MELLKLFLLCLIYIKIIAKYINFGHMSYSWGEIKTDKQGKYIACYDSVCPKKRKYIVLSETSKWTAEADQQKFEMSRNLKVRNLIRMGGTGAQICVERGLCGIVVVTPVVVELWMPSWWNDRGHAGSRRGSRAPVDYARSRLSHRREWVPRLGPPWLPVLPEGSTRPSGEAEVYRGVQAL
jgi:hypothetical protein